MMLTRLDRPAEGRLTDQEIARIVAVGAQRVVVEAVERESTTAIGVFMKRGFGEGRIGFRLPPPVRFESLGPDQREELIARIVARVADYHTTLPPTDEEMDAAQQQEPRR